MIYDFDWFIDFGKQFNVSDLFNPYKSYILYLLSLYLYSKVYSEKANIHHWKNFSNAYIFKDIKKYRWSWKCLTYILLKKQAVLKLLFMIFGQVILDLGYIDKNSSNLCSDQIYLKYWFSVNWKGFSYM